MTASVDVRELRSCFGKFATGITVITAYAPDNTKIGLTVNSFSSLSIDPPMILWSLDKRSKNLEALIDAQYFAVNVLASDQMDVSNNFARTADDKFDYVKTVSGKHNVPVLEGTVACLECKNIESIEAGDHIIFIGEVAHFETADRKPLLYTNGQYAVASVHPQNRSADPLCESDDEGIEKDNFIIPLLLRSYWEVADPFYNALEQEGIPAIYTRVLGFLRHKEKQTIDELSSGIRLEKDVVVRLLNWLDDNGFVEKQDDVWYVSDKGNDHILNATTKAQAFENEILDGYDEQEVKLFKSMLRKLIYRKNI